MTTHKFEFICSKWIQFHWHLMGCDSSVCFHSLKCATQYFRIARLVVFCWNSLDAYLTGSLRAGNLSGLQQLVLSTLQENLP